MEIYLKNCDSVVIVQQLFCTSIFYDMVQLLYYKLLYKELLIYFFCNDKLPGCVHITKTPPNIDSQTGIDKEPSMLKANACCSPLFIL